MDVTTLKAALRSLLGDAGNLDGWEDAVLTEALAQGLGDFNVWAEPVEASLAVTGYGHEVEITALGSRQVLALAYPWHEEVDFRGRAVTWRMVDPVRVWVDAWLTPGETLRVRYRKRWTVAGVGGAVQTTLGAVQERGVLLAAASHAYLIRYRQLSRRPATAATELGACKELAEVYRRRFEDEVMGAPEAVVSWPGIGL